MTRQFFKDVFHLGLKEFASLRHDYVMLVLVVYSMTVAVATVAKGVKLEVSNAAIAIVDQDRSVLSERLADAIPKPFFRTPVDVPADAIDRAMDLGRYTFVVEFPPSFERDVLAGRTPAIGIRVDATAISQAGNGVAYLQTILTTEVERYLGRPQSEAGMPIRAAVRFFFNPNLDGVRFNSVMQVINSVTILSILLVGAAVMREREHGTIEHLLVMPVTPAAIALSKIWANGLVILVAVTCSILFVVKGLLGVYIAGSVPLFLLGALVYLFATTSLGILLATVANSMPQFSLLAIPVFVTMMMLSGSMTPLESMPRWLEMAMHVSPSVYFVQYSQSILYRAAGLGIVWRELVVMALLGAFYLSLALMRFRLMLQRAA